VEIPGADRAVVEPAKVRDYLLSREHPIGRFKARVFASAGYRSDNWPQLQRDLQVIAQAADAVLARSEAYGQVFEIRAILQGPDGTLPVLTVWILRTGESFPRFVTAYPSA
jgi:hypothetical protein